MQLAPVFVSASIPDPNRNREYFDTADTLAIRDAIIALVTTVLPKTKLVFGGHPAITPMVAWVAQRSGLFESVRVYQSTYFRDKYIADVQKFGYIEVPADGDRNPSLLKMRTTMLLSEPKFSAAFFIGGMEGVEDEYDLVRQLLPGVPCYPVATTGAAALKLWRRMKADPETARVGYFDELAEKTAYTALFTAILSRLEGS